MNDKYIRGKKTIKKAMEFCIDWVQYERKGGSNGTLSSRTYHNLDYYLSGKTLIKFLESYKDFGVNENE